MIGKATLSSRKSFRSFVGFLAAGLVGIILLAVANPFKPVAILQIKDDTAFAALADKKGIVGVLIVPHVMDTGVTGRNTMIMFSRVASRSRGKSLALGWIVGGDHTKFEEAFGIYSNYPAFVILDQKKLRYASLKRKFTEDSISEMISGVSSGKVSTTVIKAFPPKMRNGISLWDGKDYVKIGNESKRGVLKKMRRPTKPRANQTRAERKNEALWPEAPKRASLLLFSKKLPKLKKLRIRWRKRGKIVQNFVKNSPTDDKAPQGTAAQPSTTAPTSFEGYNFL